MVINHYNYWLQKKYISFLLSITGNFIKKAQIKHNTIELKTNNDNIYPLSLFLQKHSACLYKELVDLVAYDYPGISYRFTLIYNLLSIDYNSRILLTTKLTLKKPMITTLVPLFAGAGWLEREVWDFFGIFFIKNIDLRRILTDYGFIGYPLRKDFPLTGFVEVLYDDSQKQIIYKAVELSQDFRNFNFKNTWK